jgi:hypothetical protein
MEQDALQALLRKAARRRWPGFRSPRRAVHVWQSVPCCIWNGPLLAVLPRPVLLSATRLAVSPGAGGRAPLRKTCLLRSRLGHGASSQA